MNNPLGYTDPSGLHVSECWWYGGCDTGGAGGGGGGGGGYGGDVGSLGCTLDGADVGCGGLSSIGSNGIARCPNNVCDGFTNGGQYLQFVAGSGGATGYILFSDIVQGLNEVNGTFMSDAQYSAYLQAAYAAQIASQYNRLSGNLAALFGDAASADPEDPSIEGGHANFDLNCDDLSVCGPGRYDSGIHIEYDANGNLVVHDDTVSPWISPISFSSFNPLNFLERGVVDLFGGTLCNCVFSH